MIVGATAIGTHDLRSTPLSPVYPGVEIHATVVDNIVRQAFLDKPDWSRVYDLVAIIALGAAHRAGDPASSRDHGRRLRRRAVRPLHLRRALDVRARASVARRRLSLAGALGQLRRPDRLLLRQRRATAQADQGDVPAVRVPGGGGADAQGSRPPEARRGREDPDRPVQRSGRVHHVLGTLSPSRDDRDSQRVLRQDDRADLRESGDAERIRR